MGQVLKGIGIAMLGFFAIKVYQAMPPSDPAPVASALAKVKPADSAPADQRRFVEVVSQFRSSHKAAGNEMVAGAQRPARASALCADRISAKVANWTGVVETLSSNGDGLGVLGVSIGDQISLSTWNNSVSDSSHSTLIAANGPLFASASQLKKGAPVRFSGTFFPSRTDCLEEKSVTLKGSMSSPEYVFRFSAIEPLLAP